MSSNLKRTTDIIFISNGDLKCKNCGAILTLTDEEIKHHIEEYHQALESYTDELTKLFNKKVKTGTKYMKELLMMPEKKSGKYVIPIKV